jgi:hypothetical protein
MPKQQLAAAGAMGLLLLALLAAPALAYYVPGTYPQEFAADTVLQGAIAR